MIEPRSRPSTVYRLYRFACFFSFAGPFSNYTIARLRGLTDYDVIPLLTMFIFGVPANLAALAAEAGYLSTQSEIFIGEVCHALNFMAAMPSYLLFHPGVGMVNVLTVTLLGIPWSTTIRAFLSDVRVNVGLPSQPVLLQLFIAIVPLGAVIIYHCVTVEVIEEQLRHATVRSLVVHAVFTGLFLLKVKDLEELIADLQSSIDDNRLLLKSSFDATCHLKADNLRPMQGVPQSFKLKEGPLKQQLERQGLDLAGRLRVVSSSQEMDQLFAQNMTDQALDASRVLSGLSELTEIVMQAGQSMGEVVMGNRVLISCVNQKREEFDLEVRVVAKEDREGVAAVCGLRCVGEKREFFQELPALQERVQETPTPAVGKAVPANSTFNTIWQVLFADPQPERREPVEAVKQQPPVARAIWQTLCCVPWLRAIHCTFPSLAVLQASAAAIRSLPAPLVGAPAPTLVPRSVGQTFRRAAQVTVQMHRARIELEGCYVHSFGVVQIQTATGLGEDVEVVFIGLPAAAAQAHTLVVLFLPPCWENCSWATCGYTLSEEIEPGPVPCEEITPLDSVSNAGLRARAELTKRSPAQARGMSKEVQPCEGPKCS